MTVFKISDVFQKLNFFTVCSMNMSSLPRLIPPCDSIPWVKSPGHIPHADYPLESWELGGNLRGNMSAHHVPLIRLQYTAVSELVLIDWLIDWVSDGSNDGLESIRYVLDLSKPWSHDGHGIAAVVLATVAGQHKTPSNVPLHQSCATPSKQQHTVVSRSRHADMIRYGGLSHSWSLVSFCRAMLCIRVAYTVVQCLSGVCHVRVLCRNCYKYGHSYYEMWIRNRTPRFRMVPFSMTLSDLE